MKIPVLRGLIDRRVLVNFRVDPAALAGILPPPFRPELVQGFGVAGICLIRLKQIRTRWMPRAIGIGSENAAHRIAVLWDDDSGAHRGVYIPRRDSSSFLNVLAGGRVFPGEHHRARFDVSEVDDRYRIAVASDDGVVQIGVDARVASRLPAGSVFRSLEEASAFFEGGSVGYSDTRAGVLDGIELRTARWAISPLEVREVSSSIFFDPARFPEGSLEFDSAFLMRHIDHEWHGREPIPRVGSHPFVIPD